MKFSILLPTRNRLSLLRHAIESVRRQDDADWEIIVSDNDSTEDIAGYVSELGDVRIQYHRTKQFVPVTDNWNNALAYSSGDYVIMLGDDDALLPRCLETLRGLVKRFDSPDLIYSAGYLYAYPGVVPGSPDGYLHRSNCAEFLRRSTQPFILDKRTARRMVEHSLKFQTRFEYNMQYSTISRHAIDAFQDHGLFFQSPFPDFYATNVLFLRAKKIVACPQPLVIVGISPKSYGFYHYNQQERDGMAFLQSRPDKSVNQQLTSIVLPGTNINTSWLFAMETLRLNYGVEFDLHVRYQHYRWLQLVNYCWDRYIRRTLSKDEIAQMRQKMRYHEHLVCNGLLRLASFCGKAATKEILRLIRRCFGHRNTWKPFPLSYRYPTIMDVWEGAARGDFGE